MKAKFNPNRPLSMINSAKSKQGWNKTVKVSSFVCSIGLALLPGCDLGPSWAKKPAATSAMTAAKPKPEPYVEEEPPRRETIEQEIIPPSGALFGSPNGDAKPTIHRKGTSATSPQPKEGKYDLKFEDAEIGEVAKVILGDTLNARFIINPKVTGKVTIMTTHKLTEDEMLPTLEMLLKANGAVLIHDHGMYRIEPEANAQINASSTRLALPGQTMPAGYQLRVVPLRYVGVTEMQKVIEPLMPPKSVIKVDETRNLMLLAGTAEELESVLETIRIFDVDFMRGMSVGLYPLKNVEAQTVAEELDKLLTVSGKGPLAGMFRIMPIERLQAILVVTPQPRYLDEVQTWIERLDRYSTNKTGNMHVYRVQNVDALELASTLSNIFGKGGGQGRTPGASLSPGLSGSSTSGGSSSGFGSDSSSSGFGGSSSSSGLGGSGSSSILGGSSSGTGSSSGSSIGGSSSGSTGLGSSSMPGNGRGMGTGFGGGGTGFSGGTGFGSQTRNRGSVVADLGNNLKIVADPANNALIIMAKPQEYREIENVIKELDVLPLQVLIDATIVEVTLSDTLKYGIKWLLTQGQNAEALAGPSITLDKAADAAIAASGPGGFAYAFAGKDIKVLITALASANRINVISAPSLMVLNNQEANINVGDKVPLPTSTSTNLNSGSTGNPFVTSTIQYQDSGVTLRVRPRVNSGGLVIMDIVQEISTPIPVVSGGLDTYKFAQRKIQSEVAVSGGDTLALGGLISNRQTNDETGLPYLNQIPWLGNLFGGTSKITERTELVVLLTPRVVEKRRDATAVTNEFRHRISGLGAIGESADKILLDAPLPPEKPFAEPQPLP